MTAGLSAPWAEWQSAPGLPEFTLGVEEEVMLLRPEDWRLAQVIDDVLPQLSPALIDHVTAETHQAALELATGVHERVRGVAHELVALRCQLARELEPLGLAGAVAGTHPFTQWHETQVSGGARYQLLYGSMRELARREPTFALHVHVAVSTPERAIRLLNRMRGHLPMLLALSTNSPFWQGRDTGLASSRIPVFGAFPRVGIPRLFASYQDYVQTVDQLISCGAFPEPTFIWWDVRLQPRFGTVEVRIMDAQSSVGETAALVALVQCLARLELEEGFVSPELMRAEELLEENRFLAARDGSSARLLDPGRGGVAPVRDLLGDLICACRPHARELGCVSELEQVMQLAGRSGAARQRAIAGRPPDLAGVVQALSRGFGLAPDGDLHRGVRPSLTRLRRAVDVGRV